MRPYQINLQSHLWGDLECMLPIMNKAINDYTLLKYGFKLGDLIEYMSPLLCFDAAEEIVSAALESTKEDWERFGLSSEDMLGKLVEHCYGFEGTCEITGVLLDC